MSRVNEKNHNQGENKVSFETLVVSSKDKNSSTNSPRSPSFPSLMIIIKRQPTENNEC